MEGREGSATAAVLCLGPARGFSPSQLGQPCAAALGAPAAQRVPLEWVCVGCKWNTGNLKIKEKGGKVASGAAPNVSVQLLWLYTSHIDYSCLSRGPNFLSSRLGNSYSRIKTSPVPPRSKASCKCFLPVPSKAVLHVYLYP